MGTNNIIHGRTCVYNCNYHIVFSTKYRARVLDAPVTERLKQIIQEIAGEKGFIVSHCEVGENDHIHIFASAQPKISPSYIVKMIKGISGRKILMEYPDVKKRLYRGHLWNPSYYIETIGSISEDAIVKYIAKQKGSV